MARDGYDTYRDRMNTPAFMAGLPDVSGLAGLDIGCGEGANSRLVAARAGSLTTVDVSRTFARATRNGDAHGEGGLPVCVATALALPFRDASFDFATAFMSLMDIPETEAVIAEAARVIRPGGFLQFSISHPCSETPIREWVKDEAGNKRALAIGDYFDEMGANMFEWLFSSAPGEVTAGLEPFRLPRIHRTLSRWLNSIAAAGLVLEWSDEPTVDDETAEDCPNVADAQIVPYFLHLRCRKPEGP